jgi:hypothetical protein
VDVDVNVNVNVGVNVGVNVNVNENENEVCTSAALLRPRGGDVVGGSAVACS